jgi:probable HAF family extracellular repeat protein
MSVRFVPQTISAAAHLCKQQLISIFVPPPHVKGTPMPLRVKAVFSTLALCCVMALTTFASAQDGIPTGKCGFQHLTIPAPAGTTATPTALNDNGAIVGLLGSGSGMNFHLSGFLFSGGVFTHFSFPGAANTFPHGINKQGVIVGSFDTATGNGQSAFMVHNGVFSQINIPGFPGAPAIAEGINELGDIVGQFNGNGSDFGFLLHQGKLTIISFPGARGGTFANSINNQGVVVGTYHLTEDDSDHGFMWKNGAFTNIVFPGAGSTTPNKINDNGDIVGNYVDSKIITHGFSLDNGRFSTIDPAGSLSTEIFALNNYDNVLGVFSTASGNTLFKGFCSAVF